MKNKFKIIGIILTLTFLAFGCKNAPEPTGMGAVSLRIANDTMMKTVLPVGFEKDDMKKYEVIFFEGSTTTEAYRKYHSPAELSNPIYLKAGSYTLEVIAYIEGGKPVAYYESAQPKYIAIDGTTPWDIELKYYGVVLGQFGTFNWNITLPAGVVAAEMTIESLTTDGSSQPPVNLVATNNFTRDNIPSDYYQLTLTFTRANSQNIVWKEVLHIYQNMTSVFVRDFEDIDFNASIYEVTFNFNYEGAPNSYIRSVIHGNPTTTHAPGDRVGYTFGGWYRHQTDFSEGNRWIFESTQILKDEVLYARWIPDFPGGTVTIINLEGEDNWEVGATLRADFTPSGTITGTIEYQWNRNGNPITGARNQTYLLVNADAGNRITVTISAVDYNGSITSGETPVIIGARGSSWENPFLVSDITTLSAVGRGEANAETVFKTWTRESYYRVEAPVTLTSDWVSIGTDAEPFTGGFDGRGFEIRRLTVNSSSANQGMFAVIGTDGEIRNVVLINADINGGDNTGGIAGINRGIVENSSVTFGLNTSGVITGSTGIDGNNRVGGIVGKNEGIIRNCYFTGSVSGISNVGGIAGENSTLTTIIENSYSTDNVYGDTNAGGIAGLNNGIVRFCYSISRVSGQNNVGGIVGNNNLTVENCVSLNPNITATNSGSVNMGRVVGNASDTETGSSARSNMRDRIIGGGSKAQGYYDGDPVSYNLLLATLFAGWNGWNITGTLNVDSPLPTLSARIQNPAPVLPEIVAWDNPVFHNTSIDSNNLINFRTSGGTRGWWLKKVYGRWLSGQMIENELSEPRPINITGLSGRNVNQLRGNIRTPYPIGNIGIMYVTHDPNSNNPNHYFDLEFVLFVPFETGSLYVGINMNPTIANHSYHLYAEGGQVISGRIGPAANGNDINFFADIKSSGDWIFIQGGVSREYIVFESENDVYYWMDGGAGHWSFGPMRFYDFREVVQPTETVAGPNFGKHYIIVRTTEDDPETNASNQLIRYWFEDNDNPLAPDVLGLITHYDDPEYGGSTTRPIIVNNEILGQVEVGTAVITLVNTTGNMVGTTPGTGYNITNSTVRVEYFLNPDFAQYVASFTCNGVAVTGNVREFNFTGYETTIDTVFTFIGE